MLKIKQNADKLASSIILCGVIFASPIDAYIRDSIMISMRDSVKLYANIFFPSNTSDFPLPVLLYRTPYGADGECVGFAGALPIITDIKRYILIVQDLRGKFESEGEDSLFRTDGWGVLQDGFDTIEWIALQSWCNGKVGGCGVCARSITQYLAAGASPPHFKVGWGVVGSWNLYENVYRGGEFREYDVNSWVLAHSTPGMLEYIRENPNYSDSVWGVVNCNTRVDSMHIPMLHFAGWYDFFAPSQIEAFYSLQYYGGDGAKGNQKLVIGPWTHGRCGDSICGEIVFPGNAAKNVTGEYLWLWYDYWLKDSTNNGMDTVPPIQLYLMGPVDTHGYWNEWLKFSDWPFENVDTVKLYLTGDSNLSDVLPISDSASYIYDPHNPVPTLGGHHMGLPSGIYNQSTIWSRGDVLTFATATTTEPYDIFGRVGLELFVSSDRYDTDFAGKLVDIYPDGRKMLITEGILMARHRLGFNREDFLTPGQIYELTIDLNYTAYVIVPGHRLGLLVTSSNYPKHSVNPNTDAPVNQSADTLMAENTVYFGELHSSVLILPVRPQQGVEGRKKIEARNIELFQNYPNPFVQKTVIEFRVQSLELKDVQLQIYDLVGRLVKLFSLTPNPQSPITKVVWDGKNDLGERVCSGVYFYKLNVGDFSQIKGNPKSRYVGTKKLLLLR
ncbi:MAG: CocE/NonD family hydrolase [Candidatus Stahlbacteria bacterium]|nr:CocE/NonD family hydrolase [Candidatus Stahlbacteria bacterium]